MIDCKALGRPPGLVGDLSEWINATAGKSQPVLSLAASLTYVGALGGRLFRGPCGERTNLYCLGIGASCSGKEHARTQIKRLNRRAGIMNLMGGEDVTSDAAIEMELERQGRVLYLWDEIGHMFGNIKDASASGHRKTIVPMLMKLYSSADKTYEGKTYADRQSSKARRAIDQPCLCLYGTTVPERLYASLDRGQLLDGFLSRCMLFETTDNPQYDRYKAMDQEIPDDLLQQVATFAHMHPEPESDGSDGDLVRAATIDPKAIPFTDPALQRAIEFDDLCYEMQRIEAKKQSGFDSIWGRASQNATKVALVLAVGCRSSVIDDVMLNWSIDLIVALIYDLQAILDRHLAENDNQRQRQELLEIVKAAGRDGITKSAITRRTASLKAGERNILLKELEDDFDEIYSQSIENTRGFRYWHKDFCPAERISESA